ncbi:MAG: succinate dehydrogenase/fumarate reductase iron-sulfur subunit [Verrucomicrobia bacterium]|nr:succinate dehydrogenase/fumarate reductase iron-sulfur subunit [Verrucomicrobiota bacterium]
MRFHLKIWRQANPQSAGRMVDYEIDNVPTAASFLEMLDILNERLVARGEDPIEHDSDCREGICGTCSLTINGIPHGGQRGSATCQLHMRTFRDGDTIYVEPWRARPFPVIKDLVIDRAAFDRIIQAGGFITARTGSAPEANALPVPKVAADLAMDAAACIGCGACVAACKNSSAMLFTAAKIAHLNYLPQGQAEKDTRVLNMVRQMDKEGFGGCTNQYECSAVCPKEIDAAFIAKMNREYALASLKDITTGLGSAVD